ncbi:MULTISPECIES: HAD family hydrolase [unclassified Polaromonas]|uniref:HAD family hydrolase n=1 Tax=unclassified Polaromonas TaxID=2638319 RepID=UPI001E29FD55|nr:MULTISPECIES: HAD family hydrolase [unclassified Polaromonas]MDH6185561.1 phosphoglycolate phosphatase/putative hydrolase of the HAD superfamily [Polaromonas sp. CG_23.6]
MKALPDWHHIDLVVFDVDGTLYDQRRLRFAMLGLLLSDAWRLRSLDTLKTLRTFRRVREALGDKPEADFMRLQYARTAAQHHKTEDDVRLLTADWLEQRPLPALPACRYAQVEAVFAGLQAAGKRIAVFSDYPAVDKLKALGLQADLVVCATDPSIARLKPDPAGLLSILRQTHIAPQRTLMIGDRFDRDGAVAQRAGVHALIRSRKPHPEFATFQTYADPVFHPLLKGAPVRAAA